MKLMQSKIFYPFLAVENLTGELPTPPAMALRTDSLLVLEVLQYARLSLLLPREAFGLS